MITREQCLDLLHGLQEPISGKDLIELQWIRDIMVKPEQVALTIILAPDGASDSIRDELTAQIKSKLVSGGVADVHVRIRLASDQEMTAAGLGHRTTAGSASQGNAERGSNSGQSTPQGHGAGLEVLSPLLSPSSNVAFIGVASGKGGVGKSTVTVNLAVALARQGKKVGIIDADIYGFSVPDMMGIEDRPVIQDEQVIPIERFGVKVMSMGFFVEDNSPIVWRGPMLGKMLRNFFQEVNWGELDVVLIDLPPGTGDIALDIHQMIPQTKEIIVTTPHSTAAFVAARAGAMAITTKHEIIGVVENMAYLECGACGDKQYVFGRGGGGKLAEALHTSLLAQIPLGAPENHPSEPDFSPSVYRESHPIGQLYNELAQRLIDNGVVS
ncbi:Mrp/NBP35 family ATP-binding protein [Paenibacillus agilis]|uniref:Iron-sulfur cluster carrier protein n=1 Tax=Paenibacillus agilis TaxID=3020863 RepID=A0A559IBI7_9BACL|nr:Mrp/NBP35 family ATP-binding protein [Paenibacillus agilis]TVX84793.1 Mrp/NBP35 family ATP-binding protein [Paenibacillus agilis]